MFGLNRVMAPTPSLHRHYPASFRVPGLHTAAILCVVPTSQSHRHSSPLRLVRADLWRRDRMSRRTRTTGISLVASWTSCVTRSWPPTPGLQPPLAKSWWLILPSTGPNVWAESKRTCISGLNTIHGRAASPVHSTSRPFCVRFNVAVTRHPATLDTGPQATSYPGGSPTRLSINHFQFAPNPHAGWCGRDLGVIRAPIPIIVI